MGLDMTFFKATKRLPFNKLNRHCLIVDGERLNIDWTHEFDDKLEEVLYFRKFYELHDAIFNLWKKENPEDADRYSDNAMYIELTPFILEGIVELMRDAYNEGGWDDPELWKTFCTMYVGTTKYNEIYYYEGDY